MKRKNNDTNDYYSMPVGAVLRDLGFSEKLGLVSGLAAAVLMMALHAYGLILPGIKPFALAKLVALATLLLVAVVAPFVRPIKRMGLIRLDLDRAHTTLALREEPWTAVGFLLLWTIGFAATLTSGACILGVILQLI